MKSLVVVIALAVVLLSGSSVWAYWGYVGPVRAYAYYPVAPAYAYPGVAVMPFVPGPVVVRRPVVVPAPVVVPGPVVYPYPVVIRPRVYYYGQPVRNALRAVMP
jgi:hypothetical protein